MSNYHGALKDFGQKCGATWFRLTLIIEF